MNLLFRTAILCLLAGNVLSQTSLPTCAGNITRNWNNCVGEEIYVSGTHYFGEFQRGKRHGQGKESYSNGNKYAGEFKNGVREGKGVFIWLNGTQYTGEFKNGNRHGSGEIVYAGGHKYQGDFKDNKFDGKGTYTIFDDITYSGEFESGNRSGRGIEYDKNGEVLRSGFWKSNKLETSQPIDKNLFSFNFPYQAIPSNTQPNTNSLVKERDRLTRENDSLRNERTTLEDSLKRAGRQPATEDSAMESSDDKRLALVIGNTNYKVRPLKNSRNDADDMSQSLRANGFEVIDLRDATLPQMRSAVRQFGDRLINNDVGLVYYSGHGVEVKGRNYFIPVNADIAREDEVADQGFDVSQVLEKMSTAGKGVNILIVDACRDDPFGRSFRSSSRGLASMDAPRGTIIAYSTSPGKVASDGDSRERNSPYTKHLVKAMQSPNKPIEQVFKEVRRAVQGETKNQQTPWENTSLSGDFYFKTTR
jgi:hypothetical protein